VLAFAGAPASAKTVKECDAEYAANKGAIKGSGEKRRILSMLVAPVLSRSPVVPQQLPLLPQPPKGPRRRASGGVKTAKECDAEYKASKDAIKASGEKKKDFVAACRAGTEVIPAGNAAAPSPQTLKPLRPQSLQ